MVRRVLITVASSARADLEGIRREAEQRNARSAKDEVMAVLSEIERLALQPDRGRIVPELGDGIVREVVYSRFRIVYRRDPTRVRIVRIWDSEKPLALSEKI